MLTSGERDALPVGEGSNREIPDPGPREDRFGDHCAPEEVPGFQSDHGRDGDQGIGEANEPVEFLRDLFVTFISS